MLTDVVYSGRDNEIALLFEETNATTGVTAPVGFLTVSQMVLELRRPGSSAVALSVTSSNAKPVEWASATGVVTLNLGDTLAANDIPAGLYDVRLTAVDGSGDHTELLNEDGEPSLRLKVATTTEIA